MYVVTGEVNEYDQYGEYFVAIYKEKPTFQQLKELLQCDDVTAGKLTRGGGRQDTEGTWYNLKEIQEGKNYWENE